MTSSVPVKVHTTCQVQMPDSVELDAQTQTETRASAYTKAKTKADSDSISLPEGPPTAPTPDTPTQSQIPVAAPDQKETADHDVTGRYKSPQVPFE